MTSLLIIAIIIMIMIIIIIQLSLGLCLHYNGFFSVNRYFTVVVCRERYQGTQLLFVGPISTDFAPETPKCYRVTLLAFTLVHRFRCTTRGRLLVCHALHTAA
jgi:hypothetical protein